MGDKPTKHSERDTVVQGLNLLDIPHSIIHVILSYLDKNSLVAVSQIMSNFKTSVFQLQSMAKRCRGPQC